MSSSICGNCQNFKPKKGDKFFNCTSARHAGIKYGMQVKADSRSCDAFVLFKATPEPRPAPTPVPSQAPVRAASKPEPTPEPEPTLTPKPTPRPTRAPQAEGKPRPTGLCVWGKAILIATLVLVIVLPAWGVYSCTTSSNSAPLPTPPPMPTNAVVKDFGIGENIWATAADREIRVSSTEKMSSYRISSGETFQAPSGKVFLFITVTCKNISNTSFMTGPAYFLLTDSAGYPYRDQTNNNNYHISTRYPTASLSPSITVSGKILWIVPVSASGLEISYLLDSGSNPPVVARWKLPE